MVADAMSLQLRTPPNDAGRPLAQVAASLAFGTPVLDLVLLAPVWAVTVMRGLAQVSTLKIHTRELALQRAQQ